MKSIKKYKKKKFFDFERIVSIILFLLWDIILWSLFVIKIHKSGLSNYLLHLTNIGWLFSILLFTIDIFSQIDRRKFMFNTSFIVVTVFFWITNGIEWTIFWLILLVIDNNPFILLGEFNTNGGSYSPGI